VIVPGVNTLELFIVNCPTHGLMPVGFFQQLPMKLSADRKSVTVTLACSKCGHATTRTYPTQA
jgi:hypothetical protein